MPGIACRKTWTGCGLVWASGCLLIGLVVGAQAPGAKVKPLGLAVNGQGHRVNIGQPAAVGMPFGMTDVVTKLGRLTAYFAFQFDLLLDENDSAIIDFAC